MILKDSKKMLQYLDALLTYGNFTRAAKALYISQPYLTQLIQKLEKELQVEIINRTAKHLQLTEAGKLYYNYLEALENETAKFDDQLSQYTTPNGTTIKLGVLSTLGSYLLPLFLPQFLQTHPDIKILVDENKPQRNEANALDGKIDFYIGQNPETLSSNLIFHECGNHSYFAIIPPTSDFFDQTKTVLPPGSIPMAELLGEQLLLTSSGSAIRRQVDYLLQKYQVQPNIAVESDNIFTIFNLSKLGTGVTIVPEEIIGSLPQQPAYNLYPLSDHLISINFFIAHRADKTLSSVEQDLITAFLAPFN